VRFSLRLLAALAVGASAGCGLIIGFGDEPRSRGQGDDAGGGGSDATSERSNGDSDSGDAGGGTDGDSGQQQGAAGYVYFRMEGYAGKIYRIKAEQGAQREEITLLLRDNNGAAHADFNPSSRYEFRDLTVSHDGTRFYVSSERYAPNGFEFTYVGNVGEWKLSRLLCSQIGTELGVGPAGRGLLGGGRVFFQHGYDYPDGGSIRREAIWAAPMVDAGACGQAANLTPATAEYLIHGLGSVSRDQTKVVGLCDAQGKPKAVCEHSVNLPYAATAVVKADRIDAGHTSDLGYPTYDLDGSILFSAQWHPGLSNRSQIWRYRAPSTVEKVTSETQNNWDPCVLSNGDIAMKTNDGTQKIRILKKAGGEILLDVVAGPDMISNTIGLYCGG
jgi:hypothetical protein